MLQETDYDRDDDPNALPKNESDSSDNDNEGNEFPSDDDENIWTWEDGIVGPLANLDVAETDTED